MRCPALTRLGAAAALAAGTGCVSDRPAEPEPPVTGAAVAIDDFAFVPANLSARTGTVIRWTNNDDVAHTVSADDDSSFDSAALGRGATFELAAGQPGTYTYFCRIHPFMKATLVVTP
jgi:plastocyanin